MKLEKRFTAPDNWQWDYFDCPDRTQTGHKIRFGFCHASKPKGLIVIAPGRTQTSEEYFEFARDMVKRHFSVAVMDWQGQGGSYRFNGDNSRQHSMGFEDDIRDFGLYLKQLDRIDQFQTLPRVLVAHSMGGHISLRHMSEYDTDFKCAVMVAPMMDIKIPLALKPFAKSIAASTILFGHGDKHVFDFKPWTPDIHEKNKSILSSDPIRQDIQLYWYTHNPELHCGGVTYSWLSEAFKSIEHMQKPDVLSKIQTPVFFALAGEDSVVSNSAMRAAASQMPHTNVVTYKDAQHVLLMERDGIRNKFMARFDRFVQKHLP